MTIKYLMKMRKINDDDSNEVIKVHVVKSCIFWRPARDDRNSQRGKNYSVLIKFPTVLLIHFYKAMLQFHRKKKATIQSSNAE